MCVTDLPRVAAQKRCGCWELNLMITSPVSGLTTTPLSQTSTHHRKRNFLKDRLPHTHRGGGGATGNSCATLWGSLVVFKVSVGADPSL